MIPSSEPNNDDDNSIAPVLPTLSFDIPALPMHVDGDHGSTAQADPLTPSLPLPPPMAEISLTFLLISGKRRTMSFAASTTIGRVKELVWNSWPVEWSDEQPPAPNYLRILYLGKMLQDEDVLECESQSCYATYSWHDGQLIPCFSDAQSPCVRAWCGARLATRLSRLALSRGHPTSFYDRAPLHPARPAVRRNR